MSIPRGATPENTFTFPIDLSTADVVYITYNQCDRTVIEKEKDDISFSYDEDAGVYLLQIELTQEESLAFNDKHKVEMQIRGRYPDGRAVESTIMTTTVDRILKDGVI